jgi:ABC-2 type transport system permease protein
MIAALVKKDLTLHFRNPFFGLITVLGLVFYIALYFLLPSQVEGDVPFALHLDGVSDSAVLSLGDGLAVSLFGTRAALTTAVEAGEYSAGLSLPAAALRGLLRGEAVTLDLLFAPGTAPETRAALSSILSARLNAIAAPAGAVARTTEMLGDAPLNPLSLRDRILPMLVLLILTTEVMGLANLIVEEVERGTARALLVTPLSQRTFLTSKVVMGLGFPFVQVFVLMLITGTLSGAPLLILLTLALGCLLIAGAGLLIAAVAREMVSVIAWGMLVLVVLVLPAAVVLFPALGAGWMRLIPSWYVVEPLDRIINYGASWGDVATHLTTLLVIGIGMLGIGWIFLRRRFA